MQRCAAVLHPSTGEGSGRAPFEAAATGAPCVYAPHSSFTELLPEEAALIVPWDPDATSDATISVLTDPGARAAQVSGSATRAPRGAGTPRAPRFWTPTARPCGFPLGPPPPSFREPRRRRRGQRRRRALLGGSGLDPSDRTARVRVDFYEMDVRPLT